MNGMLDPPELQTIRLNILRAEIALPNIKPVGFLEKTNPNNPPKNRNPPTKKKKNFVIDCIS